MILAVMDGIICNCVEKPDKVGTSTEFEPVTSRFRCDALNQLSYIYMVCFIYNFTVDSFLAGTLEPIHDQLPKSVAS